MSINKFSNEAAYNAAGVPTDESRVALIESENRVVIDGVNVLVSIPTGGEAVFEDADGIARFVKHDTIVASLIDSSWTHVGYVTGCNGKQYRTINKTYSSALQYLGVWQYSITAISSTSIVIKLRMKGNYATYVEVPVTLTSAAINSATVAEINTALEAAGNTGNIGYANHGYWAYLADDNDNKVTADADATKIIVQCDFTANWQQYYVAGTGCTIALSVWGDMPASSSLFRSTGAVTSWGNQNVARAVIYRSANGATPSSNVALTDTTLVNLDSFNNSEYCAALRDAYGTYEKYMEANKVMWPHPDYGLFAMVNAMSADDFSEKYGDKTAPKKDGTTIYVFPAIHYGRTVGYGSGKFAVGKWHSSDVDEGMEYLSDELLVKIAEAQRRMGTTVLTNNVTLWFLRRCYVSDAWFFYGSSGHLSNLNVDGTCRVWAVSLNDLD